MSGNIIRKIVIVGGQLEGWTVAAGLARFLQNHGVEIELISPQENEHDFTAIVASPFIKTFHNFLRIDEPEFVKSCRATFRLGSRFDAWGPQDGAFFSPLGTYGAPIDRAEFLSCWLKMRHIQDVDGLENYSIPCMLAEADKFARPTMGDKPQSPVSRFDYGYQFERSGYTALIKEQALNYGVEYIRGRVVDFQRDEASGNIGNVTVDDGSIVHGDLFVDCTGINAALIGKITDNKFISWEDMLPCNSEVSICYDEECFQPFTTVTPMLNGWVQKIPLQNRVVCAYRFSDKYLEPDRATYELIAKAATEISSRTAAASQLPNGIREHVWQGNCIAMGSAAGYVDDIASINHTLLLTGLSRLFNYFPRTGLPSPEVDEYNRETSEEYSQIRDYVILFNWGRQSSETPYWSDCAARILPQSLSHKLAVYKEKGALVKYGNELLDESSWISLFNGLGIIPKSYDLRADDIEEDKLKQIFFRMRDSIRSVTQEAPPHEKFLKHSAFVSE